MSLDVYGTPRRPEDLPLSARLLMVARGLWAVLRLLGSALGALVSALVALPPGSARTVGHTIADEYRAGCVGAVDADVVEDEEGQE